MKAPTLSTSAAAFLLAAASTARAQENCRSTTSTQALSCQGVRCKPEYTGGCSDNEYTLSSTQTSCADPDMEAVGMATVCYYDDVCCPILGAAGGGGVGDAGGVVGAGTPQLNNGGGGPSETTSNNNEWDANEWEATWFDQNGQQESTNEWETMTEWEASRYRPQSDAPPNNSNGTAAGVAFAFVAMAFALIYVGVSRWRQKGENGHANEGGDEERGAVELFGEKSEKAAKTIYDSDSDDSSEDSPYFSKDLQ